jgi:hypothetical protein
MSSSGHSPAWKVIGTLTSQVLRSPLLAANIRKVAAVKRRWKMSRPTLQLSAKCWGCHRTAGIQVGRQHKNHVKRPSRVLRGTIEETQSEPGPAILQKDPRQLCTVSRLTQMQVIWKRKSSVEHFNRC